ncbi:Poly ADP-ribose polymerase 1 [Taenia solium]|eukprot:TsM_000286600 transcript=TsM_000286600 gene=TsM_000286600
MGYYTEGVFVTNSSSVGQERELGARWRCIAAGDVKGSAMMDFTSSLEDRASVSSDNQRRLLSTSSDIIDLVPTPSLQKSDKQPRLHLVSRVCDCIGTDLGGSNVEDLINLDAAMRHFHKLFPQRSDRSWSIRLVRFVRMSYRLYPLGL